MKQGKLTKEQAELVLRGSYEDWHNYLELLTRRSPALETYLLQLPQPASLYALYVIKGRWPEAEPVIARDPWAAHQYAAEIIGRWPEAEPVIMQDPWAAYRYALAIFDKRWTAAEPVIMQDPEAATEYAIQIIRGRWPEAEPTIDTDPFHKEIYDEFLKKIGQGR